VNIDVLGVFREPPYAERHVRWCERWGAVRLPAYSIVVMVSAGIPRQTPTVGTSVTPDCISPVVRSLRWVEKELESESVFDGSPGPINGENTGGPSFREGTRELRSAHGYALPAKTVRYRGV
jgi:hypothetical protein